MFNRKYIFNPGPFSIAMLVYRSVLRSCFYHLFHPKKTQRIAACLPPNSKKTHYSIVYLRILGFQSYSQDNFLNFSLSWDCPLFLAGQCSNPNQLLICSSSMLFFGGNTARIVKNPLELTTSWALWLNIILINEKHWDVNLPAGAVRNIHHWYGPNKNLFRQYVLSIQIVGWSFSCFFQDQNTPERNTWRGHAHKMPRRIQNCLKTRIKKLFRPPSQKQNYIFEKAFCGIVDKKMLLPSNILVGWQGSL